MFSVVIPTCHRNAALAACLERLAPGRQALDASLYEVIVTDDGTETTAEQLIRESFPWALWTAGPKRGPAANRNHGARLASRPWIAFTDDDCLPDAGWLDAFAAAIKARPAITVCEGRTYVDRPRTHPLDESPLNDRGGNLWACNFAIQRALFLKIGGFDERFPFPSMEDTELNLRLFKMGVRPVFVPEASVLHKWRRISNWKRHVFRQTKSRFILEALYPGHGFGAFHPRMALVLARTFFFEHAPFVLRHPIEGARVLPQIWATQIRQLYWCWRRPDEASLRE